MQVYGILVVVLLVSAVVVWMLTKVSQVLFPLDYPDDVHFIPLFYSTCKTVVAQMLIKIPPQFPVRLVLFSVWAMSLILDSTYQGHITAFIAMPRLEVEVNLKFILKNFTL
ncbi:hypothetical protein Pmani_013949 [Petrolisthes manimaculis]|uniref:Uncharacterized protein n=1 Tax=Petrolisthes manimaculis TaxID=1843537 RepID=A0AAE1PV48_9EUCA|nr:hypothetical protein Pmani_013949 [Petrolisthes manimaculis]